VAGNVDQHLDLARFRLGADLERSGAPGFVSGRLVDAVANAYSVGTATVVRETVGLLASELVCTGSTGPGLVVTSRGEILNIYAGEELAHPDTFVIALTRVPPSDHSSLRRRTRRTRTVGRIHQVVGSAPQDHVDTLVAATEFAAELISTLQSWIEAQLISYCTSSSSPTAKGLYQALDQLLPPKAAADAWIAMIGPRLGFRLVDPDRARAAVSTITASGAGQVLDLHSLVARLLTTVLPRDGLLMNEALNERGPVRLSLTKGSYTVAGTEEGRRQAAVATRSA
jgi:hypothetical protein